MFLDEVLLDVYRTSATYTVLGKLNQMGAYDDAIMPWYTSMIKHVNWRHEKSQWKYSSTNQGVK